jgi:DNA polymerase eta
VPTAHGKCDTTLYRDAGTEVVAVLTRGGCRCERASVDEVYVVSLFHSRLPSYRS